MKQNWKNLLWRRKNTTWVIVSKYETAVWIGSTRTSQSPFLFSVFPHSAPSLLPIVSTLLLHGSLYQLRRTDSVSRYGKKNWPLCFSAPYRVIFEIALYTILRSFYANRKLRSLQIGGRRISLFSSGLQYSENMCISTKKTEKASYYFDGEIVREIKNPDWKISLQNIYIRNITENQHEVELVHWEVKIF